MSLTVKFGKQKLSIEISPEMTLGALKIELHTLTQVAPARQKIFGLPKGTEDEAVLSTLRIKKALMLMGTPEAAIAKELATEAEEDMGPAKKTPFAKKEQFGMYKHADGSEEKVKIVKAHSESEGVPLFLFPPALRTITEVALLLCVLFEGGGFTIFIPSLDRERQTVPERLEVLKEDGE
jgi:hypothetical protein